MGIVIVIMWFGISGKGSHAKLKLPCVLPAYFKIYLTIKKQPSEYKYLDLPEEFNEIQAGDTINVYQLNDTIFIRFIPKNYPCNNKTIVKI